MPKIRTKGKVNSIDIMIGRKLYKKRIERKMSQDELGEAIDVTFQQIQKYERGVNRLSASRLFLAAYALNTDVSYFFSDFDDMNVIETVDHTNAPKVTQEVLNAFEKVYAKSLEALS